MADDQEIGARRQGRRLSWLVEHPFIVQITGGMVASTLTASALFIWRALIVDVVTFALVIGFIVLTCALIFLVRFRSRLRTSRFAACAALVAAGFSTAGAECPSPRTPPYRSAAPTRITAKYCSLETPGR